MTTLQKPLSSGFTPFSTADDVISGIRLAGKTAIVTGGYSGLGRETVRVLLLAGARVIVPARDVARAKTALAGMAGAEVRAMDLLNPASIDAFAEEFLGENQPLHILVNSAAIMALPQRMTDSRGFELQFATNHFGHFQLTARLWPALKSANGARVVVLSSKGHRFSPVVYDDIHFTTRAYDPWLAYGQSKTANALFAAGLDDAGAEYGVRAFAVHPGGILDTNLARYMDKETLRSFGVIHADGKAVIDPARDLKSVEQGAATQVWCAVSPQLEGMGGVYCEHSDIAPLLPADTDADLLKPGGMALGGVFPYAVDRVAAARLWRLSEEGLGLGHWPF